ncbi:cellulose binding domain-containing protein [Umezawaea endophytica]|uniref:Cellulose binding domain-containing protein n=1 Tax=Umezawaea endophytica TaxID=1654476 RepID=A0A9X2VSC8_9PSEU|nr:cellulose binding domain-containing protein [Umezawaea endophytica]MCS7481956.1 cellulose binding domain-containing protein [Umezawaea endophytica]
MGRFSLLALGTAAVVAAGLLVSAGSAVAAGPSAAFRKVSDWGTGFSGEYTVLNSGSTTLSGWKVEFDLPAGSAIGSFWDAAMTQVGGHFTFTDKGWNGTLAPGQSASFGFNGAPGGATAVPSGCKLNGKACDGTTPEDAVAPSVPQNVRSTAKTANTVSLAWNASTDNVGVTGYEVYRGGLPAATVTGTTATVEGLAPDTSFTFTVRAKDAAGNLSAASAAVVVKTDAGGQPPAGWHPSYLSVGTVYEPFDGTDRFFTKVKPRFPAGKNVDYGYLYLNGGQQIGEWKSRAERLAGKSKANGLTPVFVVYAMGGNSDQPSVMWSNLQSPSYVNQVFGGLKEIAQTATNIMGSGKVGYVIEPDTLGYLLQQYAAGYGGDPDRMPAATSGAYDSGALVRGVDPDFPNTLTGFVKAMNHSLKKHTPNSFLGWQLNLWAASGAPGNGIVHSTEAFGFEAGKQRIVDNARANAGFALKAGVGYAAEFVSIDKYGLDAMCAEPSLAADPARATWFWNNDLWNNYLLFAKTLKQTLSLPVVLWQVPVGHINGTTRPSPAEYNASGTFPALPNESQRCEDSASTFFFGDTFTATGGRLEYFTRNEWRDPKLTVSGSTVTWGSHFQEAADAGVVSILMGAGVGTATRGVPQPANTPAVPVDAPTDGYYWITRVQEYYANPVPVG